MLRAAGIVLSILILAVPSVIADEVDALPTAGDVTERGRSLGRILDMILGGGGPRVEGRSRSLTLLLDVTPSLVKAEFPATLFDAMERHAQTLQGVRIGVGLVGRSGRMLLPPTTDHAEVRQRIREACKTPTTVFQNVYADIRRMVRTIKKEAGKRGAGKEDAAGNVDGKLGADRCELVLITFENGDLEDDLEKTVKALDKAGIRFSAVGREAFLSDTYWVFKQRRAPKGMLLTGAEAAVIEMPWGLRYQGALGTLVVPSGFGMYGPTRLAAVTGGRAYLFYPSSPRPHACIHPLWGFCPFCTGDHEPQNEIYQTHRLREIAPLVASRKDVIRAMTKDPYGRAVLDAWDRLSREGLVYSRPSIRRRSGGSRLEERPYRGWDALGRTTAYASEASHALILHRDLDQIVVKLEKDLEEAQEKGGHPRFRAIADTTRVYLYITLVNLELFRAFCRDVAPVLEDAKAGTFQVPEFSPLPKGKRPKWIYYRNMSLCHGPAAFRELRLPGGEDTQMALEDLIRVWAPFERRYAHTPFLLAVRRAGLARFQMIPPAGQTNWGRKVPGTKKDKTATHPEHPSRPARAAPSSGTSSGATGTGG